MLTPCPSFDRLSAQTEPFPLPRFCPTASLPVFLTAFCILSLPLHATSRISDAKKVVYKSDNEYKNGEGLFAALGVDSAAFCADQKAFIVIADYDYDNGMLVSVQCAELDANSIYRTNLTEKAENVERKMFVCNNSNEIIPLCESIVY